MPSLQIDYETTLETLCLGNRSIYVHRITSLDQTIDRVIAAIEKAGLSDIADEHCPYFGAIWPAAYALIELMHQLEGKVQRTLELGCGLGLPSLVAAQGGAMVQLVDMHPDALPFIEKNFAVNGLPPPPFLQKSYDSLVPQDFAGYDLVMASDVLYDRNHAAMLADCLSANLASNQVMLVTDPGRAYLETFASRIRHLGFKLNRKLIKIDRYDSSHLSPVHCLFIGRQEEVMQKLIDQLGGGFTKGKENSSS